MNLWGKIRDFWATEKARDAIAERECQHGGEDPMCRSCASFFNGV